MCKPRAAILPRARIYGGVCPVSRNRTITVLVPLPCGNHLQANPPMRAQYFLTAAVLLSSLANCIPHVAVERRDVDSISTIDDETALNGTTIEGKGDPPPGGNKGGGGTPAKQNPPPQQQPPQQNPPPTKQNPPPNQGQPQKQK